jgi:alkylation response protein AidB-like acyl-CoA dehydrogenase
VSGGLRAALSRVEEIGPLVEGRAHDAEQLGRLTADVVEAFHETGLLRVLLPPDLGGYGLTIPESVEVFRAMSARDASAGWLHAILGNGPLFGAFVTQSAFEEVFAAPRAVMAGSLNPLGGVAEPVPGGFRFSGRATNVSGCRHATWLMAGAWVHRDGEKSWVDGRPEMIAGLLPMDGITVVDTWNTAGMRATGSDDCVYREVFVPEERTFAWPEPPARRDAGPVGNIPMHVQLGGGIAATVVGAARGALTRFVELAGAKRPTANAGVLADRSYAQMVVGEGEGLLLAAEDTLAAGIADIWAQGSRAEAFDTAARVRLRLRMVTAARLAVRVVDQINDAAGMAGIRRPGPLERAWRDVHTATQHVLLSVSRLEVGGRLLLGLDPESSVI